MPQITYTQTSVPDFLKKFAGRLSIGHDKHYSPFKPYKIAEENRDFVWLDTPGLADDFIRDVLHKNPLPSIIVCNNEVIDAGNRSTVLWLFVNGELTIDGIGTFADAKKNEEMFSNWCGCMMPITIIENATADEKAAYYEKYNKGVPLTFGQKLKNRKHRALVGAAMQMIGRNGVFELKELMGHVWANKFKQTKNLRELEFAFQILISTMLGSGHFHTNFAQHLQVIMRDDIEVNWTNFRQILHLLDAVDPTHSIKQKKKRECFKKFIGPIIHDFWRMNEDELTTKWQEFFRLAYNVLSPEEMREVLDVGTLRANNNSRIQGISTNVVKLLEERRCAATTSVTNVPIEHLDNETEDEEDEFDDEEDDD
jgi:hypothetical protein